jgi:hypothetical protein
MTTPTITRHAQLGEIVHNLSLSKSVRRSALREARELESGSSLTPISYANGAAQ